MKSMCFDDYEQNGFSQNEVESKRTNELEEKFRQEYEHYPDPENVLLIPNAYLDGRSKNSLNQYCENNIRVLNKHSQIIPLYKQNRLLKTYADKKAYYKDKRFICDAFNAPSSLNVDS